MTPPADRPPPAELVEAAAAAWLSLRDRGMSPDETAAFLRWLQQHPRHAEVFAELDRTWRSLDRLSALPAPASASSPPDADLLEPRPPPRRRLARRWVALGAAAAVALAYFGATGLRPPRQAVATEVGAFRKLDLPDGSVAQLNTDSALEFAFTAGERRVRVVRGEVFFAVAKDPARPFLVAAGPVVVRAVGTAFNVRHRPDAVEVLVTDGRVTLARAGDGGQETKTAATATDLHSVTRPLSPDNLISAGERATVPVAAARAAPPLIPARVERVAAPAMQRALAWQERRLEFDAAPLAEVAGEFNRYNRQQLVITDAALAARRFSGVFRADSYGSFVRLLETDFGVTVEPRGDELLLRPGR
ncbi:MAG: FecR domain-containing protein [Verrucomicrobia bacterium]|nr:FecR domain-containing protein [Verrucomicrobiota bacterium]